LIDTWRKAMTKLTILSATAILAMMAETPVFAQSSLFARQEPAAFASMYPNANILGAGARTGAQHERDGIPAARQDPREAARHGAPLASLHRHW
jgi:hypothetical protein